MKKHKTATEINMKRMAAYRRSEKAYNAVFKKKATMSVMDKWEKEARKALDKYMLKNFLKQGVNEKIAKKLIKAYRFTWENDPMHKEMTKAMLEQAITGSVCIQVKPLDFKMDLIKEALKGRS